MNIPANWPIGYTALKQYLRSPAHFLQWYMQPTTPTPAMDFGVLYHMLMLEPERFAKEVQVFIKPEPDKTMASKANKEARDAITGNGKRVVSEDDMLTLSSMRDVLMAHPAASRMLHNGHAEPSVTTTINDCIVRARPDYVKQSAIIELKTTADASHANFMRHAYKMSYHLQAAMYKTIMDKERGEDYDYFLVAQETDAPYSVAVYKLTADLLHDGHYLFEVLLDLHGTCLKRGVWPGYETFCDSDYGVFDMDLPAYGGKELLINERYTQPHNT